MMPLTLVSPDAKSVIFYVVTDNQNIINCVIIQASLLLCGPVPTTMALLLHPYSYKNNKVHT